MKLLQNAEKTEAHTKSEESSKTEGFREKERNHAKLDVEGDAINRRRGETQKMKRENAKERK